jgi:hypothetical protein
MFLLTLNGKIGLSPLNYKDINLKRVLDAGTFHRHQVLPTEESSERDIIQSRIIRGGKYARQATYQS